MSKPSPDQSKKQPAVSIVIVSYNNQPVLFDCLDSLRLVRNQMTYVVDNISSDAFLEKIRGNYPKVQLIHNNDNVGFSRANNQALQLVKTPYVLVLNSDTSVPADTLDQAINYLEQHPDIGMLGCRVELANGQLDKACRRSFPTPWVAFTRYSGLDKVFPKSSLFARYNLSYLPEDQVYPVESIVGAFMLVRSTAMDEVGLFDEDYFMYGEDIDWCYRFWQKGWQIVYYPKVKILHYKGASSGIIKHSTTMSRDSFQGKIRTTKAFYNAMNIFYGKHYRLKYPWIVTQVVLVGIAIKRQLALAMLYAHYHVSTKR